MTLWDEMLPVGLAHAGVAALFLGVYGPAAGATVLIAGAAWCAALAAVEVGRKARSWTKRR